MKQIISIIFLFGYMLSACAYTTPEAQIHQWESKHMGLFVVYGLQTFTNADSGKTNAMKFNPDPVNVAAWVDTAKDIGAEYVCLYVKLGNGFCLWDSENYDNDVAACGNTQDLIGELIKACEADGLRVAIRYSVVDGCNGFSGKGADSVPSKYFNLIKKHTQELHTRYPQIFFHHFRGGELLSKKQTLELRELIQKLNPGCLVSTTKRSYNWKAPLKDVTYTEENLPEGSYVAKSYNQFVLNSVFWRPKYHTKPPKAVYNSYKASKKSNTHLWVTVAPDREGVIPQDQLEVLAGFKALVNADVPTVPGKTNNHVFPGTDNDTLMKRAKLYTRGPFSELKVGAKIHQSWPDNITKLPQAYEGYEFYTMEKDPVPLRFKVSKPGLVSLMAGGTDLEKFSDWNVVGEVKIKTGNRKKFTVKIIEKYLDKGRYEFSSDFWIRISLLKKYANYWLHSIASLNIIRSVRIQNMTEISN